MKINLEFQGSLAEKVERLKEKLGITASSITRISISRYYDDVFGSEKSE